jgi:hypothetical protein
MSVLRTRSVIDLVVKRSLVGNLVAPGSKYSLAALAHTAQCADELDHQPVNALPLAPVARLASDIDLFLHPSASASHGNHATQRFKY